MKKRYGILFNLVVLLSISACAGASGVGTTSGQTTGGITSEPATAQTQTSAATSPGITTAPRTAETKPLSTTAGTKESKFAKFYPVGKEVSLDLNGDDNKEEIYYGMDDFTIDGKSFKDEVLESIDLESPETDDFLITDINASDEQKEIGIMIMGPSDDYEVFFFTYEKKKLQYIGRVPSIIEDLASTFDGKGRITGNMRLQILQTWFAPTTWELSEDNEIVLVPQELYYPVEFSWQEQVSLNEPLPIYEKRDDKEPSATIMPQEVNFLATDDERWVEIEGEDGVRGWFKVENFDEIVDLGKPSMEVFSNLSMAD